jgi:hypothetical protein
MRAAIIALGALALSACAAEAQEGDARLTQRNFALADFDSVSLAGPHNVVVTVGPAFAVRAEGPADVLDRLEVEVKNGSLEIRQKKGKWRWSRNHGPTTVYVSLPALRAAAIGGSGDMKIDRVEGSRFAASIGGSGDMSIGSVRVEDASFSIAGSGAITAAGTAARSSVSVAGSGDMALQGLEARTASVSIVGSGDVRARATETADVSIMGSGDVTLTGTARCSVNKMGSGSVRCGA